MRKLWWILGVVLLGFVSVVPMARVGAVPIDKYYFSNVGADYYLTKAKDGTSKLHVKEIITVEFLDSAQSHGITRTIPRTNQGGANKVAGSEMSLTVVAERNGQPEPVLVALGEGENYNVYIGSEDEYVEGTQVYTLEYDLTDVVTEFAADGTNVSGETEAVKAWQELQWNVNGDGLQPRFANVQARLYLEDGTMAKLTGEPKCAVVENNGEAVEGETCSLEEMGDGFVFAAQDMSPDQNLMFAVQFEPGTFVVGTEVSYILVIFLGFEAVIGTVITGVLYYRWWKTTRRNQSLYRKMAVVTEYLPPENITVAQGALIRAKKTRPSYMATLFEMMVTQKIKVKGGENGEWEISLRVEPTRLAGTEQEILKIIAGERRLEKGTKIPVERLGSTEKLTGLAMAYQRAATTSLTKKNELAVRKTRLKISTAGVVFLFIGLWVLTAAALMFGSEAFDWLQPSGNAVSFGGWVIPVMIVVLTVALISAQVWLARNMGRFEKYTEKGVELARYIDGLELFIKLPEKRRIEFLRSVATVDLSAEGLVRLYEQLLPWACLFGVEKSWVREMEEYYEMARAEGRPVRGLAIEPKLIEDMVYGEIANRAFWFDA